METNSYVTDFSDYNRTKSLLWSCFFASQQNEKFVVTPGKYAYKIHAPRDGTHRPPDLCGEEKEAP